MHLVLESCTIRPWRMDDAESLVKHANNRKVWLGLRDLFPHPYKIEVFANNPASARGLEKAGFTLEGRLKSNVFKDGKLLDSLLYARSK